MSEQLDDGLTPDLPMSGTPKVKQHAVSDRFSHDVAFRIGFLGVGQGGGRMAEQFYKLGYGRVGVINTTHQDLLEIDDAIPKLDLQTGGAGKDPEKARGDIASKDELLWDHMTRCLGKDADYIIVCAGLGGGTGTGASQKVLQVARKYLESHGGDPERVGALLSLPDDEGQIIARNAVLGFERLWKDKPSPLIVIDNRRVAELYDSGHGVTQFWGSCNAYLAKLFHLFNRLASQRSSISTFDRADFATLLDDGPCIFGASLIAKYESPADIAEAIRSHLAGGTLAEVDISKGRRAGCIFVGGKKVLDTVSMEFFNGGFDMLDRMLAPGSMVHRGIYVGQTDDLRCYTMLGGLPAPTKRLQQLANQAALSKTGGLAQFLGVEDGPRVQ